MRMAAWIALAALLAFSVRDAVHLPRPEEHVEVVIEAHGASTLAPLLEHALRTLRTSGVPITRIDGRDVRSTVVLPPGTNRTEVLIRLRRSLDAENSGDVEVNLSVQRAGSADLFFRGPAAAFESLRASLVEVDSVDRVEIVGDAPAAWIVRPFRPGDAGRIAERLRSVATVSSVAAIRQGATVVPLTLVDDARTLPEVSDLRIDTAAGNARLGDLAAIEAAAASTETIAVYRVAGADPHRFVDDVTHRVSRTAVTARPRENVIAWAVANTDTAALDLARRVTTEVPVRMSESESARVIGKVRLVAPAAPPRFRYDGRPAVPLYGSRAAAILDRLKRAGAVVDRRPDA